MSNPCLRLLLLLGLLLTPLGVFAQDVGRITGAVVTGDSENVLPGANVLLSGETTARTRGVTTNERGRYAFSRVRPGSYTLRVSYIGYDTETYSVTVEAGETVNQDVNLESATIRQEEIVVLGTRAQGQSKALNQQKIAPNIKNVIASDQIGRFPDETVPSALQRVPGVNVQLDQGEARYVQIRGGSAGMTQVSFNGANVPSPEGEERQVALDAIPIDLLGSIEVVKAITPDMEAEATGGAVNLVTQRPPRVQTLNVEAGTGYGTLRDEVTGQGAVSYGNQFGNVGVLLSGSFNHRRFGSDGLEAEYSLVDDPSGDEVAEMEQRIYDILRQRTGATAFVDYSFTPNSRVYVNTVFTELLDDEYQPNLISIPEDEAIEFEIAPRVETARTLNIAGGGEHLLGNGIDLSYKAGWVRSEEDTPTENTLLFIREGVTFSPSVDGPQTNPSTVSGLIFDEYEREDKYVSNTDVFAQADLDVPYTLGEMSGTLEFGGKIRNKNADQSVELFVYGLADGAEDIALSDVGSSFGVDSYEPGSYAFPNRALSADATNSFPERFGAQLEREKDIEGDTEDYDILERTTAAYAMTELTVTDRLLVLPGVRFEHTRLEADGNSFDAETETITPTSDDNTYSFFFPMLHVRYQLSDDTNLRAAVTRTLERPNYFFSVPFSIRDGNEVERGNPGLDPMTSFNYDLMAEHYSESVGIISAGAFAKQLTNPIFTSTSMQDGLQILQPENASSGYIIGFELNVQRQLLFLPSPLDGLDIYANYTYTDSEATLNSGREVRLPGQADQNWNLALGYEKYGFSARVSLNYSGDYIEELGEPLETFFVDTHFQIDASASYQFTPNVSANLELVNLNAEPFVRYQGRSSRRAQQEFYQRWGRLSVRYNL